VSISVYFENRNFTPYIPRHWEKLEVEKYSRNAVWGHDRAYLSAYGSEQELWELVEMLRCPAYLSDTLTAERKWWGYVHGVDIHTAGGLTYGVSIDSMSNNVSVVYTYDKKRFTTTAGDDSDSTDEYGQFDTQLQISEISTAQAEQFRDTSLQELKYPLPIVQIGEPTEPFARIELRGWHHLLDRRYYSTASGLEEYWDLNTDGAREVGEDDRPIAAQSFQLSSASGWTPSHIYLRLGKISDSDDSTPADNFQVDLYSADSDGNPNASLTGGATVLAASSINEYYEDTKFTINTPPALSTGTTYFIHCSRSGAVDEDNYYMVGGNMAMGYTNGSLLLWDGAAWVTWARETDLNFRIVGESSTTSQISNIITAVGEFYIGTNVLNASGVDSIAYRKGDATALYEIKAILETGTTNDRRLLSRTTDTRMFEVYEEPAPESADYYLDSFGNVSDETDKPVSKTDCTVAKWVRLKGVIPGSANVSRLSDPSPVFIESAEYHAINDTYRIRKTRGARALLTVGGETG